MRTTSIETWSQRQQGVRLCGTEAHAPRRKSRASISTPHRLQILCQIEPRGRRVEEPETRSQPGATEGWRRDQRRRKRVREQTRLFPTCASAADATCPSSRPSRCSPLILQRFLQGDSGQGAHDDCRLNAGTCRPAQDAIVTQTRKKTEETTCFSGVACRGSCAPSWIDRFFLRRAPAVGVAVEWRAPMALEATPNRRTTSWRRRD